MSGISLSAILLGIFTGLFASAIAGLILGYGVNLDIRRRIGKEHRNPTDDEADRLFSEAFSEANREPSFLQQLLVISIDVSALAGAVTAWLAPMAPYLNATVVGCVSVALGLISMRLNPDLPRRYAILGALTTLPATLAGAWLVA